MDVFRKGFKKWAGHYYKGLSSGISNVQTDGQRWFHSSLYMQAFLTSEVVEGARRTRVLQVVLCSIGAVVAGGADLVAVQRAVAGAVVA